MTESLEAMLERLRHYKMTPREKFEQRVSFVYGLGDYDNPHSLSKAEIRRMLAEQDGYPDEWKEAP